MTATDWDLEPPADMRDDWGGGGPEPPTPSTRRTSWTAAELMAEDFPPPRWAVPGILPQGLTLLAGSPKLGKSWLVLNVAVAVATGGKALGAVDVDEGDVLYLALEDTGRRLQDRLKMVLQATSAPHRLTLATECPKLHEGGAERITGWLDDHPDARLVIIDTLAKVRGVPARNTDRYQADYESVTRIKAIADAYDVAVVLVHHTNKGEHADYLDAVSGTQGIAGSADGLVVLRRARGMATAELKVTGRDVTETDYALDFNAPTGTWGLLDGPASDWLQSEERRRVLEYLRGHEGDTPKAIAAGTGLDHDVVKKLVRRMLDDDQLDTDGQGRYFPLVPRSPASPASLKGNRGTWGNGPGGRQ